MSGWAGRTVLVTGAAGFLGGWLCLGLLERGARVVALVRDEAPGGRFSEAISRCTLVRGRLEDFETLERACFQYEPEAIFHLGAQALVGTALRNPLETLESNVRGTWNVLEAARRAGNPRVIAASSDKAYGSHREGLYREDSVLDGVFPYDVSKTCADLLCRSYARTYGSNVAVTRCGNFFGGGDLNWSRLVPGTVRAALAGERPKLRSDGSYVRDYLYIEDAASAYLHLAEALERRPELRGEAFNFSFESPLTVRGLVERVLDHCGRTDLDPEILDLPEARYEIPEQRLSAERARRELGWAPEVGLEEGLARTVAWYRGFLGNRSPGPGGGR